MNYLGNLNRSLLITLGAALALSGCKIGATTEKDALNQFGGVIKAQGWTPEMPPTTTVRPGLVFAVLMDAGGHKFRRILCSDIAGGAALITNNVLAINIDSSLTMNGSVGATLSESWLQVAGSATLNASAKDVTTVTFTPTDPQTQQMADIPAGSTSRVIPAACSAQLQAAFDPKTGAPKNPTYIVISALSYGGLKASYEGSGGPSFTANLVGPTGSNVNANLNLSAQRDDKGNIDFTAKPGQSMYFGTHMLQVSSLAMLSNTGASAKARVKVAKVAPAYPSSVAGLPFK